MANTGKSKPQLLSVPQIADIHLNHPPTGKAIQAIVDYINRNAITETIALAGTTAQQLQQIQDYLNTNTFPKQGNKVAPK